jgi:peptide deformylase
MKLPILQQDNPILRGKAVKVSRVTQDVIELAKNMVDTLYAFNGVGLAAPQIGQPIRLIVFDVSPEHDHPGGLINPELVSHSKNTVEKLEGCLSCKGFEGWVTRFEKVTVKGQALSGKVITIKADGLLARMFQHEIDHLNGIIITDIARPITPEEQAALDKEDLDDEIIT